MSSSHTEALAELKRDVAEETVAARTLEAESEAEEGTLVTARDAVVQAYADQDTAAGKKAVRARDKAHARAAELAVKQEAARLRVHRAEQAAQAYEAEHAADLIAELEPAGIEAVEALQHHATELVAADRRWHTVSTEGSRLLRHVPGATPATDALGEHKLSPVITAIRKAAKPGIRSSHRCPPGGARTRRVAPGADPLGSVGNATLFGRRPRCQWCPVTSRARPRRRA